MKRCTLNGYYDSQCFNKYEKMINRGCNWSDLVSWDSPNHAKEC